MLPSYTRPDWVRRINAMGAAVGDPCHLVSLDPDQLVETARRSLGLDDFGPDTWREPYAKLLEAIAGEAGLHTLGRLMTREEILRCLRTRLLLARTRAEEPAIGQERIEAPLVISGLSRSGTTILFELLAQDPRLRAPLAWEAIHPVPLPAPPRAPEGADPRPRLAECEQDFWEDVQPEFSAIHELRANLPVECITIMAPEFHNGQWVTNLDVPSFAAWYATRDCVPAYRFHHSVLQVLQHGRPPRRWLLKSPAHLGTLEALFQVYPDARVIHTHRDPARTIPSTLSTLLTTRWMRTDHVNVEELTLTIRLGFQAMLEHVIQARTSGAVPDEQIADIHFLELMRDPVAAIRRAYAKLDLALPDEVAARMRAYLETKPRGKHGTHRYTAEDWGLRAAELREQLSTYIRHHDVELED